MTFVHCHGRDRHDSCDWEQDDFWSWNYFSAQKWEEIANGKTVEAR